MIRRLFYQAQGIISKRNRKFSTEEMLDKLRQLLNRHGLLSSALIDETEDMPTSSAYRHRFNGLLRAYQLVGYCHRNNYSFVDVNRYLREVHKQVVEDTINKMQEYGAIVSRDSKSDLLTINGEMTVSVVIGRCFRTGAGKLRWLIRLELDLRPDITVACRMDQNNKMPLDYYLFPSMAVRSQEILLSEKNALGLDMFRYENLTIFYGWRKDQE